MDDFVPHSGIQRMGEWGGVVKYGSDDRMIVMFYLNAVHNPAKSNDAGRPVFEDRLFVKIHPPGERLNVVDRPATDTDKKRWPVQWHQFNDNQPQTSSGTPVEMLHPNQPSISAALKASGVHTVEQLSELSANAIESIGMGAQQWVNEATRYLQVANKGVKASELKKLLDERDRENNHLKHKLELMETELNHLREQSSNSVTMKDVQKLLSQQGGQGRRPLYPKGSILDGQFDAQTAQINGTQTRDDVRKPVRRQRPRIT